MMKKRETSTFENGYNGKIAMIVQCGYKDELKYR